VGLKQSLQVLERALQVDSELLDLLGLAGALAGSVIRVESLVDAAHEHADVPLQSLLQLGQHIKRRVLICLVHLHHLLVAVRCVNLLLHPL